MEKEENNTNSVNFREILTLLKKALTIYVHEGQERMREEEEYELYRSNRRRPKRIRTRYI